MYPPTLCPKPSPRLFVNAVNEPLKFCLHQGIGSRFDQVLERIMMGGGALVGDPAWADYVLLRPGSLDINTLVAYLRCINKPRTVVLHFNWVYACTLAGKLVAEDSWAGCLVREVLPPSCRYPPVPHHRALRTQATAPHVAPLHPPPVVPHTMSQATLPNISGTVPHPALDPNSYLALHMALRVTSRTNPRTFDPPALANTYPAPTVPAHLAPPFYTPRTNRIQAPVLSAHASGSRSLLAPTPTRASNSAPIPHPTSRGGPPSAHHSSIRASVTAASIPRSVAPPAYPSHLGVAPQPTLRVSPPSASQSQSLMFRPILPAGPVTQNSLLKRKRDAEEEHSERPEKRSGGPTESHSGKGATSWCQGCGTPLCPTESPTGPHQAKANAVMISGQVKREFSPSEQTEYSSSGSSSGSDSPSPLSSSHSLKSTSPLSGFSSCFGDL